MHVARHRGEDAAASETDQESEWSESEVSSSCGMNGEKAGQSMTRREKLEAWRREKKAKKDAPGSDSSSRARSLLPVTSSQLNSRSQLRANPKSRQAPFGKVTVAPRAAERDRKNREGLDKASVQGAVDNVQPQKRRATGNEKPGRELAAADPFCQSAPAVGKGEFKRSPFEQELSEQLEEEIALLSSTGIDSSVCFIEDGSSTVGPNPKEDHNASCATSQTELDAGLLTSGTELQASSISEHRRIVDREDAQISSQEELSDQQLVEVSEESEIEEDLTEADLKFQLFDTTNRLARCTALLQKMVDENMELRAKVSESERLEARIAHLESSLSHTKMLYEVAVESTPKKIPKAEVSSQTLTEVMSDGTTADEHAVLVPASALSPGESEEVFPSDVDPRLEAESSEGVLVERKQSPKRAAGEVEHDTVETKRYRCSYQEHGDPGSNLSVAPTGDGGIEAVEVEKRSTVLEEEVGALRQQMALLQNNFKEERQRILGKLMESEQKRREAILAMEANDEMWQQLMNNQMRALKQKVQATGQLQAETADKTAEVQETMQENAEDVAGNAAGRDGPPNSQQQAAPESPLDLHPLEAADPAPKLQAVNTSSSKPDTIPEDPDDE